MKIGFDAKRLFFNNTGLGVYSRTLVKGLSTFFDQHQYILFAKNASRSPYFSDFSDLKHISRPWPFWRTWGLSKSVIQQGCDIYHGLSHELPIGLHQSIPTVVTIHDLIYYKYPELFPFVDRSVYHNKWRYSCRHAQKIIAVSEHTKRDIIDIFGVQEEKIVVIGPPIDLAQGSGFTKEMWKQHQKKYNLPAFYLLYVGALSQRKNVGAIIRALSQVNNSIRIPLVIIGTGKKHRAQLEAQMSKLKMKGQILFTGHVPNHELTAFYTKAFALVYPSFYEGFGIPIVESLNCGTPVITSTTSSMPEAAGPGAILVNPAEPDQITEAIQTLLEDDGRYQELVRNGKNYIKRFGIQHVCSQVETLYRSLIQ